MESKPDLFDAPPDRMAHFIEVLKADFDDALRIEAHPGLMAAKRDGYEPESLLGEGGLGEVWSGVDENTGRIVAIKVHRADRLGGAINPLNREASALARVHHPGIVGLIRQGGEGKSGYLVLEFVEGLPLDQYIKSKAMDAPRLLRLGEKVCRLVGEVHAAQLVHGDLKPSNILVRHDGSPVLIDFGLSVRPDGEGSALRDRVLHGGTDRFLAPELRDGLVSMPGYATDIYALGQTLRQLFDDAAAELSMELRAVLDRATAMRPHERHGTALELADQLGLLVEPMLGRNRRRTGVGLTLAFLALATAGGSFAFVSEWGGLRPTKTPALSAAAPLPTTIQGIAELLKNGGTAEAKSALLDMDAARRGWEWRCLWASATQPSAVTTAPLPLYVSSAAINREGTQALLGTMRGVLHKMDPHGNAAQLYESDDWINHVAISDAGVLIAVDNSGRVIRSVEGRMEEFAQVAGRPGVCWTSGGQDDIHLWDAESQQALSLDPATRATTTHGKYECVLPSVSAPGWVWATSDDGQGAGKHRTQYLNHLIGPDWNESLRYRLDPDDSALCMDHGVLTGATVVGTLFGQLRYYADPRTPAKSWEITADGAVIHVVLAVAERRIFAATDREVIVFDLDREEVALRLPLGSKSLPLALRWSPSAGKLTLVTGKALTQWTVPADIPMLASR